MKVTKVEKVEAEKRLAQIPERRKGQWAELIAKILKDGQPFEVSDITPGQTAALNRACKLAGLRCRSINKGTGSLVLPAEKKS